MRIRSFLIPIILIVSLWSDNSLAYKIHAQADTVFVHAKRGATGQPSNLVVMSSRRGEDTATFYAQGWDTIRVSLSSGSEFAWGASWETSPIPFLGDRILYLEYSPTSLVQTTATITVVGDSNTIQIVVIGTPDTNNQCLAISNGPGISIPEGGSGLATDSVINLTDSAIVIDSVTIISGDTNLFAIISPSFPQTIAPHSGLPFSFRATIPSPALTTSYYAGLRFWDHGTSPDGVPCVNISGSANAYLLVPWDTIILDVPPGASDTLTLDVHAAITYHALTVHNIDTSKIYLTNVEITNTGNIAAFQGYYGPHCKHPTYNPKSFCFDDSIPIGGWSDTARFIMQVADSGTYPIDLLVNYVDGPQSQKYTILAHYVKPANAGVSIPVAAAPAANFSLNPNPASGEVTISLPSGVNTTIEIFDVLDNLVLSKQASGSFVWNGQSSAGEIVEDGAYIVRVREAQVSGQFATASKRLMVLR